MDIKKSQNSPTKSIVEDLFLPPQQALHSFKLWVCTLLLFELPTKPVQNTRKYRQALLVRCDFQSSANQDQRKKTLMEKPKRGDHNKENLNTHTHTHTNVHAHVHTNSFLDIMSLPYHQHDQQPSLTHFRLCEINSWHWWVQMALSFCLSWVTNCKQPNRKRCPSNGVLSSHVDSPGQTLPCLLIQTPFLDGLSIISPQKMMWFFNKDFSVL
jgi:hypothetical protein